MGKVNPFLWIPLPLFVLAAIFVIVSLTTHEWVVTDDFNAGLYKKCASGSCEDDASDLVKTARTLLIDVMIVLGYTSALLILYIVMVTKDKLDRYTKCCSYSFPQWVLSSSIFGCVLIIIADILVIVEAFDKNDYPGTELGYSFYLTLIPAIAMPVAGGLAFHGRLKRATVTPEDSEPTEKVVVDKQP